MMKTQTNSTISAKITQFKASAFFPVDHYLQRVSLDSIKYVKAYGDYMKIECEEAAYMVRITFKKLQEILPKSDFFRPHRSFMVRLDKIEEINRSALRIGETRIPVSKELRGDLLNQLPIVA